MSHSTRSSSHSKPARKPGTRTELVFQRFHLLAALICFGLWLLLLATTLILFYTVLTFSPTEVSQVFKSQNKMDFLPALGLLVILPWAPVLPLLIWRKHFLMWDLGSYGRELRRWLDVHCRVEPLFDGDEGILEAEPKAVRILPRSDNAKKENDHAFLAYQTTEYGYVKKFQRCAWPLVVGWKAVSDPYCTIDSDELSACARAGLVYIANDDQSETLFLCTHQNIRHNRSDPTQLAQLHSRPSPADGQCVGSTVVVLETTKLCCFNWANTYYIVGETELKKVLPVANSIIHGFAYCSDEKRLFSLEAEAADKPVKFKVYEVIKGKTTYRLKPKNSPKAMQESCIENVRDVCIVSENNQSQLVVLHDSTKKGTTLSLYRTNKDDNKPSDEHHFWPNHITPMLITAAPKHGVGVLGCEKSGVTDQAGALAIVFPRRWKAFKGKAQS